MQRRAYHAGVIIKTSILKVSLPYLENHGLFVVSQSLVRQNSTIQPILCSLHVHLICPLAKLLLKLTGTCYLTVLPVMWREVRSQLES